MAYTHLVALTDLENRPYRIPNQTESKDLLNFVRTAEVRIVKELLGITLYNAYVTGLEAATPDQKWVDLRDGAEYTYNSVEYEYAGLKNLLIPRIYSEWLRETRDKFTDVGTVYNTSERSERVSPARRIVECYNEFASKVGGFYEQCNTFYGFVSVNEADYPDWQFSYPERINDFGL